LSSRQLTRRDVLKGAIAATGAALMAGPPTAATEATYERDRLAIVGAGPDRGRAAH
jgi:hypothetical protein